MLWRGLSISELFDTGFVVREHRKAHHGSVSWIASCAFLSCFYLCFGGLSSLFFLNFACFHFSFIVVFFVSTTLCIILP